MRWIAKNSCELTVALSALENSIACQLSTEEVNLVSAVFMQLGDTLATITAQRTLCEKDK